MYNLIDTSELLGKVIKTLLGEAEGLQILLVTLAMETRLSSGCGESPLS